MGLSIESLKDSSQFSRLCCYPTSLENTLISIAFFGAAISCELVIVDMCNCVSAWIQEDMLALLCYLKANKTACNCSFLDDMENSCMVSKAFTQFCKKSKKEVKLNPIKGVYRDFSKDLFIGFYVI